MAEIISFALDQVNSCVGSCYRGNGLRVVTVAMALFLPAYAWEDTCKPFPEIYADGEELCNKMFDDSFEYTTDEDKGYTMWWFGGANPNHAAAAANGLVVPTTCNLKGLHKTAPSSEGDDMTECHPWKDEACCNHSTVKSAEALRTGYGGGYEWDRCGPMSPECERFFVQEGCMYECDVTAGLYRKCTDAQVTAAGDNRSDPCRNKGWQMYKMPIKASYCNAWFDACRNDRFCGGGDFFECNSNYWESQDDQKATEAAAAATALQEAQDEADTLSPGIIAVIAIAAFLIVALCSFLVFMARKEKKGDPLFQSLNRVPEKA